MENEQEYDENEPKDVFAKFNNDSKLLHFAALQLEPRNHGKNIRFEHLIFNTLKSPISSDKELSHAVLTKIFESYYTYDFSEDPADNFFTENVTFFDGNYVVYPGIADNGTLILNAFLEGIFTVDEDLPHEYKHRVYQAVRFMLEVSNTIAERCNHKRYIAEDQDRGEISVPPAKVLTRFSNAVTFTKEAIEEIAARIEIPSGVLMPFICQPHELPEHYHNDDVALLNKPLYQTDENIVVMLPTGIVLALSNFIKSLAVQYGCVEQLLKCYYEWQWKKTIEYAYEMSWKQIAITLPPTTLDIHEGVFLIDNDKLAYVCFVQSKLSTDEFDIQSPEEMESRFTERQAQNDRYAERNTEVLAFLQTQNERPHKFLSLFVVGHIGEFFVFATPRGRDGNHTLMLSFPDYQKIVFYGELDILTFWKFARVYELASKRTQFGALSGPLNAYEVYRQNQGSLLPSDDAAPDLLNIDLGMATNFGRDAIKKRDEHGAPILYEGRIAHLPVKRHRDYAPIYVQRELRRTHKLVVESYKCPIWIINVQAETMSEKHAINDFVEAVAFWLYKLTNSISQHVNQLGKSPVTIEIEIDRVFIDGATPMEWLQLTSADVNIEIEVTGRHIKVTIPGNIAHLIILENNIGERHIMKRVLDGISLLLTREGLTPISNEEIGTLIDTVIPLGPGKMILYVNVEKDPRLRNDDLLSIRYIQDADTSYVLDTIVANLNLPEPIPSRIESVAEKTRLCNKIVMMLINQIEEKIKQFDAEDLLNWLMIYNERYVHHREFREVLIPARIACFSDIPSEVEKLRETEGKLVGSSLAVRCLIEFVAATPSFGEKTVNVDDLDELIALMHAVCDWGVVSDTIHLGMDNPVMGLLPSGRIGMSREFFKGFVEPFHGARAENEIHDFVTGFERKLKINTEVREVEYTPEVQEIDDAFASEYNITLTKLMYILRQLITLGVEQNSSVIDMEEEALIKTIDEKEAELSREEIVNGLDILSLKSRHSIITVPDGFDSTDIMPWRYNRSLSYIRRPLVKIRIEDGTIKYYWGYRHVVAAGENLRSLIMLGRIRTRPGTLLESLVASINHEKGTSFRNKVVNLLKNISSLRVIDYEVTINPNGHLHSETDLGDIDVMAIDDVEKVVYSIECKNTVSARIAYEMKTELDKYLGRDGASGMIQKHVERDAWLNANTERVEAFIGGTEKYTIKSLILTSEEIPLIYLAKERLPMPVVSYKTLQRTGIITLSSAHA